MATSTYRQLFEESLDDWIGRGSGMGDVLELVHKDRDVWLFLFVRWLRGRLFSCQRCGEEFLAEELEDVEGSIVCPSCRRIS